MSCIPTFSGSPALAANASASAEVAAKAWRLVTGVFIVHFLGATRSQSALVETRRFRRRPSKHGTTTYSSRNGRPMSEMGLGRSLIPADPSMAPREQPTETGLPGWAYRIRTGESGRGRGFWAHAPPDAFERLQGRTRGRSPPAVRGGAASCSPAAAQSADEVRQNLNATHGTHPRCRRIGLRITRHACALRAVLGADLCNHSAALSGH